METEIEGGYQSVPVGGNSRKRLGILDAYQGAWKSVASIIFFGFFVVFLVLVFLNMTTHDLISNHSALTDKKSSSGPVKPIDPNDFQSIKTKSISRRTEELHDFSRSDNSPKPNFVFILSDDVGYGTVRPNDETGFTPFLNTLAHDSIVMKNYYSQEICAPARAAILTGRYPARLGLQIGQLLPTEVGGLGLAERTLPQVLKEHGNYKTYGLGKWNLGHSSTAHLPINRGFDYYLGSLTSENTYWTKSMPNFPEIRDFFEGTPQHYGPYQGDDLHEYSTFLYRNHAKDIISNHDFTANPMFLYIAFQAAHPFEDFAVYPNGLNGDYFSDKDYDYVLSLTNGKLKQQYALSIMLMDGAIKEIVQSLADRGVLDNTYIIYTADNGGCPFDGGYNNELRGTKGTLFEGGVKVDALLYHTALEKKGLNGEYTGLMHGSDWFPTILELASISSYQPPVNNHLDGYSHVYSWAKKLADGPRSYLMYNMYQKDIGQELNSQANVSFAVRDQRFKLLRTYAQTTFSQWYPFSDEYDTDDTQVVVGPKCTEENNAYGPFETLLFDLVADPFEKHNLVDDPNYERVKMRLMNYAQYHSYTLAKQNDRFNDEAGTTNYWLQHGKFAQPWLD